MKEALEALKQLLTFISDFWSPEKRNLAFKLHLEKRAYRKVETAEEYIHTSEQYRSKVTGILNYVEVKAPDLVSEEDRKSIRRLARYLDKYEKRFRNL